MCESISRQNPNINILFHFQFHSEDEHIHTFTFNPLWNPTHFYFHFQFLYKDIIYLFPKMTTLEDLTVYSK